jgi:GH25 family lysozyme M1 (1,4-beta-N-acetylmuramidase)
MSEILVLKKHEPFDVRISQAVARVRQDVARLEVGNAPTARTASPGPAKAKSKGAGHGRISTEVPGWLQKMPLGIDISRTQVRDWSKVADSRKITIRRGMTRENTPIQFVFLEATGGISEISPDPRKKDPAGVGFKDKWERLKKVRGSYVDGYFSPIYRGAYHFYLFAADPVRQAEAYCKAVGALPPDAGYLRPVLDIEDVSESAKKLLFPTVPNPHDPEKPHLNLQLQKQNRAKAIADLKTWIQIVKDRLKRDPIIYTGAWFWPNLGNPKDFSTYPLWISDYSIPKEATPKMPDGGWSSWDLWQFRGSGKNMPNDQFVEGIGSDVDLNVCRSSRTLETLADVSLGLELPPMGM